MNFLTALNALPPATNGLTQAHVDLLIQLHGSGDRGGFYLAYAAMLGQMTATSNTSRIVIDEAIEQCYVQAHISTYSGFIGGAALLGNAVAKFANPERYDVTLDEFSNNIVLGLRDAINRSFSNPQTGSNRPESGVLNDIAGFVGADAIQRADQGVWEGKGLKDYFPGNFQLMDEDYRNLLTAGTIGSALAGLQLVCGARVGFEASDYSGTRGTWQGIDYILGDGGRIVWVSKPGIVSDFASVLITEDEPFERPTAAFYGLFSVAALAGAGIASRFNDALALMGLSLSAASFYSLFSKPEVDASVREKLITFVGAAGKDFSTDGHLPVLKWQDFPLIMRNEGSFLDDANPHVLLSFNTATIYGGGGEDFGIAFGKSVLHGGLDDDILAGNGNAKLFGDSGADILLVRENATADGGEGNDWVVAADRGATGFGGAGDDLLIGYDGATVNGGSGNDWVFGLPGGAAVITIGGAGRDWIWNTSAGGIVYGDTIDGQGLGGGSNSDNFWWTPNTTIMDAGKNDVLKFFGIPLAGGTNNLPGLIAPGSTFATSAGLAFYKSQLFVDEFMPFMSYIMIGKDLYVTNTLAGLMSALIPGAPSAASVGPQGAMKIKDFDFNDSPWGVGLAIDFLNGNTGDLGMQFKRANPFFAALAMLPPTAIDSVARVLGQMDELLSRMLALLRVLKSAAWAAGVDPLILDLDGDGIETTALDASTVYFDHNNNLFAEKTGWLSGDDGFLVRDENGNGLIDQGSEMFGGLGQSGIDELATYDSSGDGKISVQDAVWGELRIWRDLDQDGATDEGELFTLDAAGLASIGLGKTPVNALTPQGNTLVDRGSFSFVSGGVGNLYDAMFDASAVDTKYRGQTGIAPWLKDVGVNAKAFGAMVDLAIAMSNDIAFGEMVKSAAAAMSVPKLKLLREQSADVLGQWGQVLEQTRELTAVRIQTIDGKATLADYGVYEEDATGGFFTLQSGAAIVDANGQTIARATLEDVLAQVYEDGAGFTLTQTFSPSSRGEATKFRTEVPYLTKIDDGRVVILDHGVKNSDGSWALASNPTVSFATANDILASAHAPGTAWTTEAIGFNPYADIPVETIGIYFLDGKAVDYTVEVTDDRGAFYVWARNLDYAMELQQLQGHARGYNLRNFEVVDNDNVAQLEIVA